MPARAKAAGPTTPASELRSILRRCPKPAFTTAAYHWAASPKRFPDLGAPHTARRLYYNTTNFFFPGRPSPLPSPWTVTLDVTRNKTILKLLEAASKSVS